MRKISTRNASGLVEALVVMAVIGTTLVSSMLLVAQGFIEVRNNQTEDTINGILVQTLNRLKNSSTYTVALNEYNTLVTTTDRNFYLRPDNELKLDSTQSPNAAITTCPTNSVYNIIGSGAIETSITQPLCIQITIRRLVPGSNDKFRGSINYVYQINEEVVVSKLNFVKYNQFLVPGSAFQSEPVPTNPPPPPQPEDPFDPNPGPGGDQTF